MSCVASDRTKTRNKTGRGKRMETEPVWLWALQKWSEHDNTKESKGTRMRRGESRMETQLQCDSYRKTFSHTRHGVSALLIRNTFPRSGDGPRRY